MLAPHITEVRLRLDALQQNAPRPSGMVGWALGLLAPGELELSLPVLAALDREMDQVGVHTLADAHLLRTLGAHKGRAGKLSEALEARATEALEEFEALLRRVERAHRAGELPPGTRTVLERAFIQLARVVKVADVFSSAPGAEPPFEIFSRGAYSWEGRPPASARMAIAEFLAQRARGNVEDVLQKRRDLDLAHEMLLRLGADHDRDRGVVLRREVAEARERTRTVPPAASLAELVKQVRVSARREPHQAYRSLKALYERSLEAADVPLAAAARAALVPFLPPRGQMRALVEQAERDELMRWFGESRTGEAVERGEPKPGQPSPADDLLTDLAFSLKPEQLAAFELAAGCARYFDVEDALSEEVVQADVQSLQPVPRRVPYPTQRMSFEATSSLHEVHNFVISDPRMIVYDLAASRQLVRAYLEEEPPPKPKRMKRTSVRVYVCDASGSMHGARARFRDAIIIAELNNLRAKARQGQPFDPLYFSFFNDSPTELVRVDTAAGASRQIEKLFRHSPAEGQTDINLALISAFDSIRSAQGRDPYLARATVVLITDGEDRVDQELIRRTRVPMSSLDISLSFISLGEENPDLKALVQEQRSRGGRAFYHHLSDAEIQWARTEFDVPWRTLLPHGVPETPEVLEALLPHLDALEALAGRRGPPAAPVAVEASFDALFPERPSAPVRGEAPGPDVVARVGDILAALAEAASLAPADRRATESVQLLQHLLGVYQLTPARYLAALAGGSPPVQDSLARVRLLCRPFG
ncbi:von Willebrand factor type A domain-containing protein [Stigmatella aurantiaca]|uniref:von Willebrand factor type A domain-containing protein n=1 Tax=Stigmatella aurantiaca TaxID=41 RepID=A0A1H8AH56_STIAU|nr:vWA domain-containing protein [Stigmatella aurantiaca]SEM70105.1 von Willebrand factor type A domain-containing protein [Stigmatella aurantiaca]